MREKMSRSQSVKEANNLFGYVASRHTLNLSDIEAMAIIFNGLDRRMRNARRG